MSDFALPQMPEPFWRTSVTLPELPSLTETTHCDVTIIGAGITGIITGYLLVKQGLKVIILDDGKILNGTTGHTTAKITAQHGLIYDELIGHFGQEKAHLYYDACNRAMAFIRRTAEEHQIDCDLSPQDAYIFTNSEQYLAKLEKELAAYEKLNIPSQWMHQLDVPFPHKAAIAMKNQAQFHPLKFLLPLVQAILANGSQIYENTQAIDIEQGAEPIVSTRSGAKITCNHVVVASHFPFYDGYGFYFARMYQSRSYVLGLITQKEFPEGMYISAEQPTRSLRYTQMNGKKLVLLSGDHHKTGQGICTMEHYKALQDYAEQNLGIVDIPYRWSTQDLTTLDKVPYIGAITPKAPNILVATGYRKWGLTSGTTAALLMTDMIMDKPNPWQDLYTPNRLAPDPSIKEFVSINADVAKHLVAGKLEMVHKDPEDLSPDEGAVVRFSGKRAGAYKDPEGKLYMVDTTCTHMGCELEWNSGDRTWDCPCHGSRFTIEGKVIEGPAQTSLKKLEENPPC